MRPGFATAVTVLAGVMGCSAESAAPVCPAAPVRPAWVGEPAFIVQYVVPEARAVLDAPLLRVDDWPSERIDVTAMFSEDPFDPPVAVLPLDSGGPAISGAGSMGFIGMPGPSVQLFGRGSSPSSQGYSTGTARWAGDTVVTIDANSARVIWHHPARWFVRTRLVPSLVRDMHWATPIGVLPGERLVLQSQWTPRLATRDSVVRPPIAIAILDNDADQPRIIARPPGYELAPTRVRGANAVPVYRGKRTVVAVWDTLIVVGDGANGTRLDLLNGDGDWVGQICVPGDIEPAQAKSREPQRAPYARAYVTPSGVLWLLAPMDRLDTAWTALGLRRDGQVVGRLRVRGWIAPAGISDDSVYTLAMDTSGFVWLSARGFRR